MATGGRGDGGATGLSPGQRQHLAYLPSPAASLSQELTPSYVVPKDLLGQLLSSNLRLEKILANPLSHVLEQIEVAIRQALDNPSLTMEEKNERYANLLSLQSQVKDHMGVSSSSWLDAENSRQSLMGMPVSQSTVVTSAQALAPAVPVPPIGPPHPMTTRATDFSQLPPDQKGLLIGLPLEQRGKAEDLLHQLNRFPQVFDANARGNLVLDGRTVVGSNIGDVIATLFKLTPPQAKAQPSKYWSQRLPTGMANFLSSYAQTPLAAGLIRNTFLAAEVQQLRQGGTSASTQMMAHRVLAPSSGAVPSPQDFAFFADRYRNIQDRRIKSQSSPASTVGASASLFSARDKSRDSTGSNGSLRSSSSFLQNQGLGKRSNKQE
jgi:hypothetical protein